VHGTSVTFVTVGIDRFVDAEHPSFEVHTSCQRWGDWDNLLAEIYKNDEQARARR
jgi:hypothetical protein